MKKISALIEKARRHPAGVSFAEMRLICDHFFGPARQKSTSHRVYKTPWRGDPRVNIQNRGGMAKAYQVRQVLKAVAKLEERESEE